MGGHAGPNITHDNLLFHLDPTNKTCYNPTGDNFDKCFSINNTTLSGSIHYPYVQEKPYNVFCFKGNNDQIKTNFNPNSDIGTNAYSVSLWFNVEEGAKEDHPYIYTFGNAGNYQAFGLTARSGDTYKLRINNNQGGSYTQAISSTNLIQSKKWHNVVVTRTGNDLKLYLDGNTTQHLSLSNSNIGNNTLTNTSASFGWGAQASNRFFTGELGPIKIYSKVLNSTEIKNEYQSFASRFFPEIAIPQTRKNIIISAKPSNSSHDGVATSTDGGTTFSYANLADATGEPFDLATAYLTRTVTNNNGTILGMGYSISTDRARGLYVSTDSGATWKWSTPDTSWNGNDYTGWKTIHYDGEYFITWGAPAGNNSWYYSYSKTALSGSWSDSTLYDKWDTGATTYKFAQLYDFVKSDNNVYHACGYSNPTTYGSIWTFHNTGSLEENGFGSASIWFPGQNTFTCIIPLGMWEGKRAFGSGGNLGGANSSKIWYLDTDGRTVIQIQGGNMGRFDYGVAPVYSEGPLVLGGYRNGMQTIDNTSDTSFTQISEFPSQGGTDPYYNKRGLGYSSYHDKYYFYLNNVLYSSSNGTDWGTANSAVFNTARSNQYGTLSTGNETPKIP